ncbi:MAG: methyltransferase domain-containing protein [Candidatus Hydrogenedentes bacterium]|nr:methyltransferase domain-containing protein [Candidatus Hydrogenedentota bacterium]
MDTNTPQYSPQSIARYECIFGRDFVSTGGLNTTKSLTAALGLRPGMRVLDVGCGLGGSVFHLAQAYGVEVLGIDVLPQMIDEAARRSRAYGISAVEFVLGDILQVDLPTSFDLVYSRDAFLHIAQKPALFARLFACLRPGGILFFTDYARGHAQGSRAFEHYRAANSYDLHELDKYATLVRAAGFAEVGVTDRTEGFIAVLRQEMQAIQTADIPLDEADRRYLVERWFHKVEYCQEGDMRWCSIRGSRRPTC